MKITSIVSSMVMIAWINSAVIAAEDFDPPEITNGERLFLETRFAEFFNQYLRSGGDVNVELPEGDPVLDSTVRFKGKAPKQIDFAEGPFGGKSINCRSCHLVDEHLEVRKLGMRTYTDFARRSPLPMRPDNRMVTVRNSPPLVNASVPRKNFMLHFDGEFSTMLDLVKGTLTGRNYGWLPQEKYQAIKHICKVVKLDDGSGGLASEFGQLSFTELFSGKTSVGNEVPAEFLLPEKFRFDVTKSSCRRILHGVSALIAAYTEDLMFEQDDTGAFALSPYDQFLIANNLPRKPEGHENAVSYSKRLLHSIRYLEYKGELKFVRSNPNTEDGGFEFHNQKFRFGKRQLAGLKTFFSTRKSKYNSAGNCIACHAAPNFTDFDIHNTGVTQIEYDGIHGDGKFARLFIPNLYQRSRAPQRYLPATARHPNFSSVFRDVPNLENPRLTDLGAWNILGNRDFPKAQRTLAALLCDPYKYCKLSNNLLKRSIATFKTPGLRDLSHSAPYMHNGQFNNLKQVILFYQQVANLSKKSKLRNPDPNITRIQINESDVKPLVAFLKSLNEDYN